MRSGTAGSAARTDGKSRGAPNIATVYDDLMGPRLAFLLGTRAAPEAQLQSEGRRQRLAAGWSQPVGLETPHMRV